MKRIFLTLALACSGLVFTTAQQLVLPKVLSSHMVLQREKPVPVWGKSIPGTTVCVEFAGQALTTRAAADSSWSVQLKAMPASFEPKTMRLVAGATDTLLTDILVGEVWLCGGQSNMEYPMDIKIKRYAGPARGENLAEQECKTGGDSRIRLMLVEKKLSLPDCTSKGWQVCADSTLRPFSACGYFFGKHLAENLNVPIGLISSSWGGSRIEPWTPESAYEKSSVFAAEAAQKPMKIDNSKVGHYYQSMIAPLAPFALKGFIWYQGESNAMIHDARYVEKTDLLLKSWQSAFRSPDAPFYYVQIAPYTYTKRKDKLIHTPQTMAKFCALQTQCLRLPNTGQAVVTDLVDNLRDIHPSYKWEVGRRLALQALSKNYGRKELVVSGPVFKQVKRSGKKLKLTFDEVGSGLTAGMRNQKTNAFEATPGAELTWFEVAAAGDTVFHAAKAVVKKGVVEVSCPEVSKPAKVRFCWNEAAMPNFFNREGLPAVPFQDEVR